MSEAQKKILLDLLKKLEDVKRTLQRLLNS